MGQDAQCWDEKVYIGTDALFWDDWDEWDEIAYRWDEKDYAGRDGHRLDDMRRFGMRRAMLEDMHNLG